jgi:methyltransferase (TIGR00027 family)
MIEARPSATAQRVAMRRAAHQFLDVPKVFDDPLALRILGKKSVAELRSSIGAFQESAARSLRAFLVARSRFAEDELACAVGRGATQCVILGAGLDTFAYRNPYPESSLRVFEVDYLATQLWKQLLLAEAEIAIPSSVTYAPVDFEHQTLADGLAQAGFDSQKITFFSWLGVTPYLTRDAVISTFSFIANTPQGGGVVFDYAVPRSSLPEDSQLAFDALARRVAAAGEPFQTFFDPQELAAELRRAGFRHVEDLDASEINSHYFKDRADGLSVRGSLGHLASAKIDRRTKYR